MSPHHLRLALAAVCGLAGSAPLRAQEAPAEPPSASAMFTERGKRKAAYRGEPVLTAVRLGNGWLVGHQDEDGGWDCNQFPKHDPAGKKSDGPGKIGNDLGVSALALLALLAQADPAYLDAARKSADFLAGKQDDTGLFAVQTPHFVYDQAIATLALTEAAALLGTARYRNAAMKGLQYLETHRNRTAAWRYNPHAGENDTSITSWCIAAYCAATHAGIEVSAESVADALVWLESATDFGLGSCGYSKRGEPSVRPKDAGDRFPARFTEALTAAGIEMQALAGFAPDRRFHRDATARLLRTPPIQAEPSIDFYYWFHGSAAMAAHPDKAAAQAWFTALHKTLLPLQRKDGACLGSWDPNDAWGDEGGRIYSTAMAVLALSSPWRLGALEASDQVPDVPPFRRVHSMWKDGRFGVAMSALAEAKAAAPTPEQLATIRRIEWFAAVQTAFCERVLARTKEIYADACDRHDRLAELGKSLAHSAPGKAAADAAKALLADPEGREEIEAGRSLREALDGHEINTFPKDAAKRRGARERLEKLVAKYPKTAAAKLARDLIKLL